MPRIIYVVLAMMGLVLGAPLWLLIALVVKLSSPGPVFFHQDRVGRHGRLFQILKFRTMHLDPSGEFGPLILGDRDPRVTRVGRFLRHFRIDEFPQLWNVIRGDMSLVGPRPERPFFAKRLSESEA